MNTADPAAIAADLKPHEIRVLYTLSAALTDAGEPDEALRTILRAVAATSADEVRRLMGATA